MAATRQNDSALVTLEFDSKVTKPPAQPPPTPRIDPSSDPVALRQNSSTPVQPPHEKPFVPVSFDDKESCVSDGNNKKRRREDCIPVKKRRREDCIPVKKRRREDCIPVKKSRREDCIPVKKSRREDAS